MARVAKLSADGAEPKGQLHAYTVTGDAANFVSSLVEGDAVIAIIPTNAAAEARLRKSGAGRIQRAFLVTPDTKPAARVKRDAFEPDARARALLRGIQFAQADLQDAGGSYDVDQVRTLLHDVSRQAIDKRVKDGRLLAVPGPSNRRRFPTIQFGDDGEVVEGLKAVQDALAIRAHGRF